MTARFATFELLDLGEIRAPLTLKMDINCGQRIDLLDLAELTAGWLEKDCSSSNQWCCLLDLDMSGTVDLNDFSILAENCIYYETADKEISRGCECREKGDISAVITAAVFLQGMAGGQVQGTLRYEKEQRLPAPDPSNCLRFGWREGR